MTLFMTSTRSAGTSPVAGYSSGLGAGAGPRLVPTATNERRSECASARAKKILSFFILSQLFFVAAKVCWPALSSAQALATGRERLGEAEPDRLISSRLSGPALSHTPEFHVALTGRESGTSRRAAAPNDDEISSRTAEKAAALCFCCPCKSFHALPNADCQRRTACTSCS